MSRTLRFLRVCLWLIPCIGLAPSRASAGPWTKSLGGYYTKLNLGAYRADGYRDANGDFQEGVTYESFSPALYAEVGVWKNLHVQAYVPYLMARNRFDASAANVTLGRASDDYARTSFADTNVAVQWSTPWLALPHALRLEAKLPLYDVNALDSPRDPNLANFPAPGDGQLDVTAWLSVGQSFERVPLFLIGELGHQFRSEQYFFDGPYGVSPRFGDSLRFFGQSGLKFLKDKYWMLSLGGTWPWPGQDTEYTKGFLNVGTSLFFPVGAGFALEGSVDQAVHGVNSALGTSVSVGVSRSK